MGGIRVKVRFAAAAFAMLAAAMMARPGLAEDDNETPIDCSKTDLQFAGERFEVKCAQLKGEQIQQSDGSAQVQTWTLNADSTKAADWLVAVDSRILGSLAIRRVGLEENIHFYFPKLPTKNWKGRDAVQGFEAAEFESSGGGEVQDCVAFQRFFNRRYNGFSRWVVGVTCSSDGREVAYRTLGGFSGPGD
jgi:hypothetical protein